MTLSELQSKTVIQLRKIAREQNIILGAGVDKHTMIEKIAASLDLAIEPEQQSFLDPSVPDQLVISAHQPPEEPESAADGTDILPDERQSSSSEAAPSEPETESDHSMSSVSQPEVKAEPVEPRFQAAWHSPDSPQAHNAQIPVINRPSWQNPAPSSRPLPGEQRAVPLRPHSFGPRFGPSAVSNAPGSENAPVAAQPAEPQPLPPQPEHRMGIPGSGSFGPRAVSPAAPAVQATESSPAMVPAAPAAPAAEYAQAFADTSANAPTLEELLATGDFEEGSGILELHPDGYGFLRASNFLPSSRDIYVSMAQIRRFSLRTGDLIQGKIRPQREGDKYAALLYIDSVNGLPEEEAVNRPFFEELTPVYPTRKISLESKDGTAVPALRLIDLIAPLGFGQRALILCPPDTGKRELLAEYARVITANYPDLHVLTLLIDLNPEDVTSFRDAVPCPVLSSTFDQAPEAHLRLTEMVAERAMRLVEQKQDVVILADSLTRLAKIYTTAAVQQGRSVPGMVNPASLLRAKRLFGAARSLKEGGSLTVIATMDIQTGNKVDDSIVEEFKGTANMELMLDQAVARVGIKPPINLLRSFTKKSDILLDDEQKEGLSLIRQMLGSVPSTTAIPQLLSMMDKAATNSDLLIKMKDWFALMSRIKS